MTRIFTILMSLCACIGALNAESSRSITIRPYTGALVATSQVEDTTGTVKFQKQPYWIRPNYQLFLDGAPSLKVSFGFRGAHLDVFLPGDNGDVRIVSAKWDGDRYNGLIDSKEGLAQAGINDEDLVKALSFLTAVHYCPSKDTWTNVQQDAVTKGEVALRINPVQPSVAEEVVAVVPEVLDAVVETEESALELTEDAVTDIVEEVTTVVEEVAQEAQTVAEEVAPEAQTVAEEVVTVAQDLYDAAVEEVLSLANQAEEAYQEVVVALDPPTEEQEAQAVAEFVESLPEALQDVVIDSPLETIVEEMTEPVAAE